MNWTGGVGREARCSHCGHMQILVLLQSGPFSESVWKWVQKLKAHHTMYYFMHQQHMNRPILWIIGLGKVKEEMAQGKKGCEMNES
jgi:hypothetical protein